MTVSSTSSKVKFVGNNSTTVFNFSYTVYAASDLVVTLTNSDGVDTTLTEGTGAGNYSVTVASFPGAGSITYPATGSTRLQADESLTISRVIPLTQTIDLQNQGGYFPDVQEEGFDRGIYISQQLKEESDRSIKASVSDSSPGVDLPAAAARANRIMAFDGSGDVTTVATDSLSLATLQAFTNWKVDVFTAGSNQTVYALSADPGQKTNTTITIDGVTQEQANYSWAGQTITLSTAPATGSKVEIRYGQAAGTYVPVNNSIPMEALLTSDLDTDLSSVSGSDDTLASAKAIKTYVDAQVDTVDTLAEVLSNGNGTGGNDIAVGANDDITLTDASTIKFGTGGDGLSIYHNGNHSYITEAGTGTGNLYINATDLYFGNKGYSKTFAAFTGGDGDESKVRLYYNSSTRIETTNGGARIYGDLQVDGGDIELGSGNDTTISRASAGVVTIEGQTVRTGTVAIANGGTGATTAAAAASAIGVGTEDSPTFTGLTLTGNADIDGTTNLDAVDIDGAVQIDSTLTVGVDDAGHDVKFFGDTASASVLWDASADDLILYGAAGLVVPDSQLTLGSTAVTATAAEINLIDGGTARGTVDVASGDGILINDGGTMRMTNVDTVSTYFSSISVGGSNIVTTGALNSGSITSGFGSINVGSSAITTTGDISGGTVNATSDTAAGDNAAIGYTAAEGLILTGQGTTSDLTVKNDADQTVFTVPTGSTNIQFGDASDANTTTGRAVFGADADASIRHNGSNFYIYNGTGNTLAYSDTFQFFSTTGSEVFCRLNHNAAVELFYDNVKKLETTSSGVNISANEIKVGDNAAAGGSYDSVLHLLGDASSGFKIGVDSGNTLLTIDRELGGWQNNQLVMRRDTGAVGINVAAPSEKLAVGGNITATGNITSTGNQIKVGDNNASSTGYDSVLWLLGDSSSGFRLSTNAANTAFNIERELGGWQGGLTMKRDTGNVGIGCSDPGAELEIAGDYQPLIVNSTTSSGAKIVLEDNGVARGYLGGTSTLPVSFYNASAAQIGGFNSTGGLVLDGDGTLIDFSRAGDAVAGALKYVDADTGFHLGTTTNHDWYLITNDTKQVKIDNGGSIDVLPISSSQYIAVEASGGGAKVEMQVDGGTLATIGSTNNVPTAIQSNSQEYIRVNTSGHVGINRSDPGYVLDITGAGSTADQIVRVADGSPTQYVGIYNANTGANAPNSANATLTVRGMDSTVRSINAGGTVNASGNDYAEYMTKAAGCGTIQKGSICGVDADGKLTDQFDAAHSFVVKSTDPSYVGGDVWGIASTDDDGNQTMLEGDDLEAARQRVDRIAFAGQVPCLVTGSAAVGDYIVPQRKGDGGIEAVAVSSPDFDQYRSSIGKVWKLNDDNKHIISVKIG